MRRYCGIFCVGSIRGSENLVVRRPEMAKGPGDVKLDRTFIYTHAVGNFSIGEVFRNAQPDSLLATVGQSMHVLQ